MQCCMSMAIDFFLPLCLSVSLYPSLHSLPTLLCWAHSKLNSTVSGCVCVCVAVGLRCEEGEQLHSFTRNNHMLKCDIHEGGGFKYKHTAAHVAQPALTLVLNTTQKTPLISIPRSLSPSLHNFRAHSCLPQEQPVSGWINCLERKELPVQRRLDYTTQHPVQKTKKKEKKEKEFADGGQEARKRTRDGGWRGEGGGVWRRRGAEGDHIMEKGTGRDCKGRKKMELKGVTYSTLMNHYQINCERA